MESWEGTPASSLGMFQSVYAPSKGLSIGVGVQLGRTQGGEIVVIGLAPGGAAELNGNIHIGDVILDIDMIPAGNSIQEVQRLHKRSQKRSPLRRARFLSVAEDFHFRLTILRTSRQPTSFADRRGPRSRFACAEMKETGKNTTSSRSIGLQCRQKRRYRHLRCITQGLHVSTDHVHRVCSLLYVHARMHRLTHIFLTVRQAI